MQETKKIEIEKEGKKKRYFALHVCSCFTNVTFYLVLLAFVFVVVVHLSLCYTKIFSLYIFKTTKTTRTIKTRKRFPMIIIFF